jgi:hypothetical protein
MKEEDIVRNAVRHAARALDLMAEAKVGEAVIETPGAMCTVKLSTEGDTQVMTIRISRSREAGN